MPMQRLETAEVAALAEGLGIHLTATEAAIFTVRMTEQIDALEAFMELRIEEHRLPLRHLTRDPGYRPTEAEDPLNAFIRRCHVEGTPGGPLSGRTVALKDHTAVAGVPMTFGSRFMEGYVPEFDATITTRLLDAGATIIAKTNMEDFSFGGPGIAGVGDYGRPLNPHDHAHVTGGSSSGGGAAVAGGYADIAFGGDQGGSVRIPAAWSGCVGLMPTHGLLPHTGVFGLEATVDYAGPLTRTVDDLARVLAATAGPDGEDPRQAMVPPTLPDYVAALDMDVAGLTIGVLDEGFGVPGGLAAVDEAVRDALATLEKAGATLKPISIPAHKVAPMALAPIFLEGGRLLYDTNLAGALYKGFYPSSTMAAFGRAKVSHAHELPLNLKHILLAGTYARERYNGRLYAKAQNVRPAIVKSYAEAFAGVDLLAMPTVPVPALEWTAPKDYADMVDRTLFGGELGADLGLIIANTAPFNYTGFPALSIPCGKIGRLPVGLQLAAPFFREDTLIRAAHTFQQAVDWDSFYP